MGGGSYSGDVDERARSTRREVFTYRGHDGPDPDRMVPPEERKVHNDLDAKGKVRECLDNPDHPKTTPIVLAIGTSRSRGDDAKIIYAKMPMFIGQMYMHNYVPDPTLCVVGVGDTQFDRAAAQIGQFEADNRIDDNLAKLWLERGGGGNGRESYELVAWYFANRVKMDATQRGKKGYLFFSGDQCFYAAVKKEEVKKYFGVDIPQDLDSAEVFAELQKYFNIFFIYPQKSWEERKGDIDAEIRERVERAGGLYEGVDVRASLIWSNRNDLDLHVIDPCGHHIFYGTYCKSSGRDAAPCGGFLDVDMNVRGETMKPVENIRWAKGHAPRGHYKVFVQNFATHSHPAETEFKVEVEVNGEIKHFEGKTPPNVTGSRSDTPVYEFFFDPDQRELEQQAEDKYAFFRDDVVKGQWSSVIPPENILVLPDPAGIIDLMMGAIVATNDECQVDVDAYIRHMAERDQSPLRQEQTRQALEGLATAKAIAIVGAGTIPIAGTGADRRGKAKRL